MSDENNAISVVVAYTQYVGRLHLFVDEERTISVITGTPSFFLFYDTYGVFFFLCAKKRFSSLPANGTVGIAYPMRAATAISECPVLRDRQSKCYYDQSARDSIRARCITYKSGSTLPRTEEISICSVRVWVRAARGTSSGRDVTEEVITRSVQKKRNIIIIINTPRHRAP